MQFCVQKRSRIKSYPGLSYLNHIQSKNITFFSKNFAIIVIRFLSICHHFQKKQFQIYKLMFLASFYFLIEFSINIFKNSIRKKNNLNISFEIIHISFLTLPHVTYTNHMTSISFFFFEWCKMNF